MRPWVNFYLVSKVKLLTAPPEQKTLPKPFTLDYKNLNKLLFITSHLVFICILL